MHQQVSQWLDHRNLVHALVDVQLTRSVVARVWTSGTLHNLEAATINRVTQLYHAQKQQQQQ